MVNLELLKSPQNWVRIMIMLALGFITIFLVMHFIAPKSVEPQ